jgi:hypothetical protein
MGADPANDKINVHSMTIRNGAVRFIDVQSSTIPYDSENAYLDHYVAMPPTRMEDLKVLATLLSQRFRECSSKQSV